LYDTASYTLAARLTITRNFSLSGVQVELDSRFMTETGFSWNEFDLSESDADCEDVAKHRKTTRQAAALPGVSVGEAKNVYSERELHVWGVAFAADSQHFAVATTHGVFIFSADMGLGTPSTAGSMYGNDVARFVPTMLTKNVSALAVNRALEKDELAKAMVLALALNDYGLLRKVYEKIPPSAISITVASIGAPLLPALLWFISLEMRPSTGTPHFQFHVDWVAAIIDLHFVTLLEMTAGKATARTEKSSLDAAAASSSDVAALCLQLLVELSQRHATMGKVFNSNSYLLDYLSLAPAEADEGKTQEPFSEARGELAENAAPLPARPSLFEQITTSSQGPKESKQKKLKAQADVPALATLYDAQVSEKIRPKKRKRAAK